MAIRITDTIKFIKPATISLIANFSRFITSNTAEIAKGNTMFAVTIVICVCSDIANPSEMVRKNKTPTIMEASIAMTSVLERTSFLSVSSTFLSLLKIEGIEWNTIEARTTILIVRPNACKIFDKSKNVPVKTPCLVTLNSTGGLRSSPDQKAETSGAKIFFAWNCTFYSVTIIVADITVI